MRIASAEAIRNIKTKGAGIKMGNTEDGRNEDFGTSYYQLVNDNDILTKFRPLLIGGGYKVRDVDGKLEVRDPSIGWETPWQHIKHDNFLDCQRWHSILFNLFSMTMPRNQSFVPSACQQCWKVVARPKTLLGLFSLMELQKRLGRPSKCGIEVRQYVHGLYGGYFYNHSIEEGLECYKLVRSEIDKAEHLGPDTPVILKRGCTEYENRCGPSDNWIVTQRQLHIETLINEWVVRDVTLREQPEYAILYVHKKWIEFAYQNGDGTYLNFTGGKPLYRPLVTYHHLVDSTDEEREEAFSKFKRKPVFGYDL